jgi:Ribonuclease G/E
LAEWLYEEGIGENRAILVEDGTILEAAIELPGELRAGAVVNARLTAILVPGRRGIVELPRGAGMLEPLPGRLTEGQAMRVEIVREAIAEQGRPRLANCRATGEPLREGPSLADRIAPATRHCPPGADRFEDAGWSELLDEAATGEIAFPGGALRMSVTPAMTLFDVDGTLNPAALAAAGAAAAGRAIRRLGIAGSIGIDLPTLSSKAERQAAAAALDAALPQPFERTAVNGFGFLQIVRRRERASLAELLQGDPVGAAARALLRRTERTPGAGERTLRAAPPVVARIEQSPHWLEELGRRIGAPIALRPDPGLAISAGHVHSQTP